MRFRVAAHGQPGAFGCIVFGVALRPVAVGRAGRHAQAAPGQQAQRFVVQRRRFVRGLHLHQQTGPVRLGLAHGGILVAQQKLDAAVLRTVKAAGVGQVVPQCAVFGRCHADRHVPGVWHQFHPELAGLVLDDEPHCIGRG